MARTLVTGTILRSGSIPPAALPAGTITSSVQLANTLPVGTVSSSTQVNYSQLQNIPTDIVSSSTQVTAFLPTGTVSSSTQLPAGIASSSAQVKAYLPTDTVSSSAQVTAFLPNGTVSGSGQINVFSTVGGDSLATTGSNTFTGVTAISDTTNSTSYLNGALTVAGGMSIQKDLRISGSMTINGLLTVVSMSSQYVTSSQYNLGVSKVTVNDDDNVRFAGLSVYDSGSSNATASIYWDSLNHKFIYENLSGSNYNSAILLAGPQNNGALGSEAGLTVGRVPVASGDDHIDSRVASSSIRVDFPSKLTHVEAGLYVTGSVTSSGNMTVGGDLIAEQLLIGTTNIDVGGTVTGSVIKNSGQILVSNNKTDPITSYVYYGDRRGTNNSGPVYTLALGGYWKADIGIVGTNNSTDDGVITFNTISGNATRTERMRIRYDGNVGINTTSPTARLEVSGSNSQALLHAKSPGATSALFVSGSGNVGIGTTTPTYDVSIEKTVAAGSVIVNVYNPSSTGAARLYLGNDSANNAAYFQVFGSSHALKPSIINIGGNANYPLVFDTNGTERMRLDTSGNLGLAVTASAWSIYDRAIHFGNNGASISSWTSDYTGAGYWFANNNSYFDGTNWLYIKARGSAQYRMNNAVHSWYTAGSGTIGTTISDFATAKMTLDSSGNLGIGITNPSSYSAEASSLVIGKTAADAGMTIRSGNTNAGSIYFADTDSGAGEYSGFTGYSHNTNTMYWGTNEATQMTLNSSGVLSLLSGTANGVLYLNASKEVTSGGALSFVSNILQNYLNSNTANAIRVANDSTGAAADSYVYVQNSAYSLVMGLPSTGFTTSGIKVANTAYLYFDGPNGINIGATNASGPLKFFSGGTTVKMTLDADGDLGIGITNPSYPLEIASTNSISIAFQRTGVAAKKWGFDSDNSNLYIYNITDGTRALTLSNAGNIGIGGTTGPGRLLHVYSTSNTYVSITAGTGSVAGLLFGDSASDSIGRIQYDNSNDSMTFLTNSGDRIRITSAGDVGVGTTGPKHKLHVNGAVQVGYVDTLNDAMLLSWNGSSTYGSIQTFSSSNLVLNPSGNNVGIGTTDASLDKLILHAGRVRIRGATVASTFSNSSIMINGYQNVADDSTLSASVVNGSLVYVVENNSGDAVLFFATYYSGTVIKLADPSNIGAVSDTDGKLCAYKNATSSTITIKNRLGDTKSITVGMYSVSD